MSVYTYMNCYIIMYQLFKDKNINIYLIIKSNIEQYTVKYNKIFIID